MEMKKRAHLLRGLVNLLNDDITCVCIDADTYDLFNIEGSVQETRDTLNKMYACIEELESTIRISKRSVLK
jgi:hypothetical protein